MSEARRDGYRALFQRLEPGARNALRKIYDLARNADPCGGDPHGRHVILAMLASARHPDIARISLSNLIIRLGLKQATLDGDEARIAHYQGVIADFHAALDEFMGEPGRASAVLPRQMHPGRTDGRMPENSPGPVRTSGLPGASSLHERVLGNPVLLDQLLRFKTVSGPAVARVKQASRPAS